MPTGRREFMLACAGAAALRAAATPPTPPPVHPRLYLQPRHVPELRVRLEHPALAEVVKQLAAGAARSRQLKVEWDAIHWLISPDPARGRPIVEECLALLRASQLPDRNDACRVTGRMMATGAIVYDWLYPLLTAAEKEAFIAELIRLAKTQECGYPPTRGGSVTGHASEAMIMREILSAGIAIYDEHPEMYRLAAERFFTEHLPARNWFYPGHAYHQGDSYGPYRYSWDVFPLFIFDRLGAGNVYNPQQRWVPYHSLYCTRPDGQRLRGGDTYMHSARPGQPWQEGLGTVLTASYYGDGVLLGQHLRQQSSGGENAIFEFLWRDVALEAKPVESLPRSRYFGSPFGWMVARTGWDSSAVIAEMKVNEYNFNNHQHLDAGSFQIYYKGALAIDSGLYQGRLGGYGSEHCKNYLWRTVAHNSLLVHDPKEEFGAGWGNDGGQRLPNRRSEPRNLEALLDPRAGYRTGEVLAHGFGPDPRVPAYTLLQGDLTRAYGPKVTAVRRSAVFLNFQDARTPAALVVFDRVAAADPSHRKTWLLHSLEEPRVNGNTAVVDVTGEGRGGRLFLDVLLPGPGRAGISKVGGPGREFEVGGRNYPQEPEPGRRGSWELGAWRTEVSPREPSAEDLFLTVMQVADQTSDKPWPVKPLDFGDRAGCSIEGPDASWAVLFRKDSTRSDAPVRFVLPEGRTWRILAADLVAGRWSVAGGGKTAEARVEEQSGALWLTGSGGEWTLRRA